MHVDAKVQDVHVDGEVPFSFCDVHVNVDVKTFVQIYDVHKDVLSEV